MTRPLVRLVLPDVQELLREASPADIAEALEPFHAADLADLVEGLADAEAREVFLALVQEVRVETFEQLEDAQRLRVSELLGPEAMTPIVEAMAPDDRADFLGDLDDAIAEQLLAGLSVEEQRDAEAMARYPDETAGGIMTSEFVALRPDWTAQQAIEHVRRVASEREMIFALYVVDDHFALVGVVSVRALLVAPSTAQIAEIMESSPISVPVMADQETVVERLRHYDFVAIPVVDERGKMLGIVTHDDALDVALEEAEEDAQLMGAVEPLQDAYLATGLLTLVRKRATWLSVLFVAGLVAGSILKSFEATLEKTVALIFFLPLIIASGGNSGSQSATLVTRGLAMGDVRRSDWWRITQRELASGILLGALLGGFGLITAVLWQVADWPHVALTVWATLIAIVTCGSLLGSLLPLLLDRIGIDPAITSAPLVACLVDIVGILIYVLAAGLFL